VRHSAAEMASELQAQYVEASKIFVEIFDPLRETFERELETAGKIIRGPRDRRKVANEARARVRAAMYAAAGSDPESEVARAKALLARIEHELRRATLARSDHFPQET